MLSKDIYPPISSCSKIHEHEELFVPEYTKSPLFKAMEETGDFLVRKAPSSKDIYKMSMPEKLQAYLDRGDLATVKRLQGIIEGLHSHDIEEEILKPTEPLKVESCTIPENLKNAYDTMESNEKFKESIKSLVDELVSDEMRSHSYADKSHELVFQIYRLFIGYDSALRELSGLKVLIQKELT